MSDANPLPENPYAAPQVVSAELVPAVDPAEFWPGELPCHRCGQGVLQDAATCPRCGASPLYDGLQLIVTAVLVYLLIMGGAFLLQSLFPQLDVGPLGIIFGMIAAIAVVIQAVKPIFKLLRRGRW